MQVEGKLANEGSHPKTWDPVEILPQIESNQIRFSRGFLQTQVERWLSDFSVSWQALFHSLGVEVELLRITPQFNFPDSLSRIVPIEIDNESAVIGMDDDSQALISDLIVKEASSVASDLIVEYMERRLLASLNTHWAGDRVLRATYVAESESSAVEVVGTISVEFKIAGELSSLWFGLGARAVERLDGLWRKDLLDLKGSERGEATSAGGTKRVSVELAELAVPPSLLIDYMRSGTIIDLELPLDTSVNLVLGDQLWATGSLLQAGGNFAVEVLDLEPVLHRQSDSVTRVSLQLAVEEIEAESLFEFSQLGAILPTQVALGNRVSMIISGEIVATATLGIIGDNFALCVLPK